VSAEEGSGGLWKGLIKLIARTAEKRRAQGPMCKKMRISVRTGMFNLGEATYHAD
jgi:hypothetical protein